MYTFLPCLTFCTQWLKKEQNFSIQFNFHYCLHSIHFLKSLCQSVSMAPCNLYTYTSIIRYTLLESTIIIWWHHVPFSRITGWLLNGNHQKGSSLKNKCHFRHFVPLFSPLLLAWIIKGKKDSLCVSVAPGRGFRLSMRFVPMKPPWLRSGWSGIPLGRRCWPAGVPLQSLS